MLHLCFMRGYHTIGSGNLSFYGLAPWLIPSNCIVLFRSLIGWSHLNSWTAPMGNVNSMPVRVPKLVAFSLSKFMVIEAAPLKFALVSCYTDKTWEHIRPYQSCTLATNMLALKLRLRPLLFFSWFRKPEQFILKHYPTHFLSSGFYLYTCNTQLQETGKLAQWCSMKCFRFTNTAIFNLLQFQCLMVGSNVRSCHKGAGRLWDFWDLWECHALSIAGWLGWRLPWAGTRRCGVRGALDAIAIR